METAVANKGPIRRGNVGHESSQQRDLFCYIEVVSATTNKKRKC